MTMVTLWARLGIQKKIFAGLAAILGLMAAMVIVGIVAQRNEAGVSDQLITRLLPARAALRSVRRLIVEADDAGAWYILAAEPARRRFLAVYRTDTAQIDRSLQMIRAAQVRRYWAQYKAGNEHAFALASRGEIARARRTYVNTSYQPLVAAIDRYESDAIDAPIRAAEARRAAIRTAAAIWAIALAAAALGIAIVIAMRLGGTLRRRLVTVSGAISEVVRSDLARLDESFRNIAEGDLDAPRYVCDRRPLAGGDGDELAVLASSYNELTAGLHHLSQHIDESVLSARRRREAEERLSYLQQYDETTGLANRRLLHAQLERAIRLHRRGSGPIAVAYVGLIGLEKIEDSFGRDIAARALKIAAYRLEGAVRESDLVARAGYAEFAAVRHAAAPEEALEFARGAIARLSQPFMLGGRQLVVSVGAGISLYPRDGQDADELLRNANTAMWYARDVGTGEVALYDPRLRSRSLARVTIESDLQRALAAGEFEIHYQPIVNILERRICSFEALLRWRHPRLGLLQPSSFIDVAEDSGAIEALGTWVLETACAQVRRWRAQGHDVALSVNVSMRQFRGNLLRIVQRALANTNFPPHALELELTESLFLADRESAEGALAGLKRLGVGIAIDDFGTGYSSFAYLRSFPLDALKIDRSFVTEITSKPFDVAIARAIILMGRSLGIRVIAEGVEDARQGAALHKLGCDVMQGYYFGKPLPPNESLALLESAVVPAS